MLDSNTDSTCVISHRQRQQMDVYSQNHRCGDQYRDRYTTIFPEHMHTFIRPDVDTLLGVCFFSAFTSSPAYVGCCSDPPYS